MPLRATNLQTPALGLPLEAEEEVVQDVTSRRAQLAVGAWAGPRTLAKREKMLMSSSARAKRDKRHAEAQQLEAVLLKYKQLGGELSLGGEVSFPSHLRPASNHSCASSLSSWDTPGKFSSFWRGSQIVAMK